MKRNPFSKSTISFNEQKELSERVRTIVTESWNGIKATSICTPTSFYENEALIKKIDSEQDK